MKAGTVCLIGRPNAGKSTLVNAIVGHKVAITSPKPQTTRFPIRAVYEDNRGQILFTDTPGIFAKASDTLSRKINPEAESALRDGADLILYVIDHTRQKSFEENRALGIVRKSGIPTILVINKTDIREPTYEVQYKFMESECAAVVRLSAQKHTHINTLLEEIFARLPEGEPFVDTSALAQPAIHMDSKTYLAEIIREKAFLFLRREVPYSLTAVVDDIEERDNGVLYIKARILTSADRYKSMIIGAGGRMVKEISMAARKELETASGKKVFVDLSVETDGHWMDFI
ncbi:GTPase Era [Patescibacteria group bacterium]|nr:GTPase Era [Patescibacteria group bacterium]